MKFYKKGNFNHISEIVGGLREISPGLDESICIDIAQNLATKLQSDYYRKDFTTEERTRIEEVRLTLQVDSWIKDGIHP